MSRVAKACGAVLLAVSWAQPTHAYAAKFSVSTDREARCSAVELSGEIKAGDDQKFRSALAEAVQKAPLRRLYLNSGGGDFATTAAIWQTIRGSGYPVETIVRSGQQCNSACVLLLAVGTKRYVSSGATIIVHQGRNSETNEPAPFATLAYGYYLVESGFSRRVAETMTSLKADQELSIQAWNAKKLGFDALSFFGSTDPPATNGCAWKGFLRKTP